MHFDFIPLTVIAPVWFWNVRTNVEKVIKIIAIKERLSRTRVARTFIFIGVIHFLDIQTRFYILLACFSPIVVRIHNWKQIYMINYKLPVFILSFEMTIMFTSTMIMPLTKSFFCFVISCTLYTIFWLIANVTK